MSSPRLPRFFFEIQARIVIEACGEDQYIAASWAAGTWNALTEGIRIEGSDDRCPIQVFALPWKPMRQDTDATPEDQLVEHVVGRQEHEAN